MRKLIACFCAAMGIFGVIAPGAGLAGEEIAVPELTVYRRPVAMNEALEFVQKMKIGWNLGNTFDATRDGFKGDEMSIESYWVGVKTTEEMIAAVQEAGFQTLRVPVSWHNHVDADFTVSKPWLDRVQEVVDYAIDRGMYVILNTHHDNQSGYYYPDSAHIEVSERYIRRVWEQLAERFRDYDERLIFESMNEPRLAGHANEWNFDASVPECVDSLNCIMRLNQTFVDAVRASGGNNSTRYLMVPSYAAAPYNATSELFSLPEDAADNRLIVSVHAYTPYSFALEDGGVREFKAQVGTAQSNDIVYFMNALYDRYVTKGIPVVIGEFGARDKANNTQARVDFASYYVALASARGMTCCWWDNNAFQGGGELFGLLNRRALEWPHPEIVDGMMKYAGYDALPEAQK